MKSAATALEAFFTGISPLLSVKYKKAAEYAAFLYDLSEQAIR